MKFNLLGNNIHIDVLNKSTSKVKVCFSFSNTYLPNARQFIKTDLATQLYNLEKVGSIAVSNVNPTIIIVSLGEKSKLCIKQYQQALKSLANWIKTNNTISDFDVVTEEQLSKLYNDNYNYIEQTIFHLLANIYSFNCYKQDKQPLKLKQLNVVAKTSINDKQLTNILHLVTGITLVKDLGNLPANVVNPSYLANLATKIAKGKKNVSLKIFDHLQLAKSGMNCILAVGNGSDEKPKLIHLTYNGGKTKEAPIVLVGKGITFDSGGLSLKSSSAMTAMKFDMMGAANVLATFQTAVDQQLPINLMAVVACAENMPSGSATRPGDIVKSLSGKTVEIINTDAEGRLVLADALTYVTQFKPKVVLDFATLTGAAIIALGANVAPFYTNEPKLADIVRNSSLVTHEKLWEMPLVQDYLPLLKNSHADLINTVTFSGQGGSILAALFLEQFVNYPWVHFDIAGPVYTSEMLSGVATGRYFALIMHLLNNL
jgi:leucyl aminopeptidase